MKDEKTLETRALIGQFTDSIEYEIDDFLADGVMTASIVVSYRQALEPMNFSLALWSLTGVLLAGNQLFRVEKLSVRSGANLI